MSKPQFFVNPSAGSAGARPADKLKAERVELELKRLPQWQLQRGGTAIGRRLRFTSPGAALAFAGLVTSLAERSGRRPRILLEGNELLVSLSTPEVGGITGPDLALARRIHGQI